MSDSSITADEPRPPRPLGVRVLHLMRSPRLALWIFLGIVLLSVYGTLLPPPQANEFVRSRFGPGLQTVARAVGFMDPYHSPLFTCLIVLLCANIATCTVHRLRRMSFFERSARSTGGSLGLWSDLLMHLSLIVIIAGAAAKGYWGFTATQYILPGIPQQTVLDARTKRDVPLGFTILLREVEETFYPIRARIGVKNAASGEKLALTEVTEGRSSEVAEAGLTLTLERYDPRSESVLVAVVQDQEKSSFSLETRQDGKITAEVGGLAFTLVAYSREQKNIRGLLSIKDEGRPERTAWISPTTGITHRGTRLYQTAWGIHPEQGRYIGLQVSRDPFASLFWGGCILLSLSLPLFVISRLRMARLRRSGSGSS